MAMATTPPDAPRCSYRVGPTQNAWTTAGGSTTITLTTGCAWVASSDASWVRLSEASGTTTTTLTITVNPAANSAARAATLTIGGQLVTISQAGHGSTAPFGFFDTPQDGASGIIGSLAVTGWALDDVGRHARAHLPRPGRRRESGGRRSSSATRRSSTARVPTSRRRCPCRSTRGGLGLSLLTNMLPNQGNGTFTLHAYADDAEGHTVAARLAHDHVRQRERDAPVRRDRHARPGRDGLGHVIVNFGWALTPQPNMIPDRRLDASTSSSTASPSAIRPTTIPR